MQASTLPAHQLASCGDVSCELLVDPIPRPKPQPFKVSIQPQKREVVLVDNRKPNSMQILRMTQAVLRERGIEVREEIRQKPSASLAVTGELLGSLAQERGLVLLGVND